MSDSRAERISVYRSLLRTIGNALAGRLHFPRKRLGTEFLVDGEPWTIFREARVDPGSGAPADPEAIFIARFHLGHMSVRQNIWFSWLPMLPILGIRGFRSKLWMYNRYGDFMGFYRWDKAEDAERYAHSAALTFMTRRSAPGSASFRILTNYSLAAPSPDAARSTKMAEIPSKSIGKNAPPLASR